MNPGSLLVAFQRLERSGLLDADWHVTDNNRKGKFYRLTAKGRKALDHEAADWARRSAAMARLMEI